MDGTQNNFLRGHAKLQNINSLIETQKNID